MKSAGMLPEAIVTINLNRKKSLKITKESTESVNQRGTDNAIVKRKRTKGQTTIYNTHT